MLNVEIDTPALLDQMQPGLRHPIEFAISPAYLLALRGMVLIAVRDQGLISRKLGT